MLKIFSISKRNVLYLHYLLHYLIELIFKKKVKNIFDFKTQCKFNRIFGINCEVFNNIIDKWRAFVAYLQQFVYIKV